MTSEDNSYRPVPRQPNITVVNKNQNTQIVQGRVKNPLGCGFAIAVGIIVVIIGGALHNAVAGVIVTGALLAGAGYLIYNRQHPKKKALPERPVPVRHYHGNILHAHLGGDISHDHANPQP